MDTRVMSVTKAGQGPMTGITGPVRNVLWNWGGYVLATLVAFFLSPFVIRQLGDSAYGVWTLVGSLTGYLGLLDMGVRGAVTRYVARFHALSEHEDASRTASTALSMFALAGTGALLIASLVATAAIDLFHIPEVYRDPAVVVLILTGASVATS